MEDWRVRVGDDYIHRHSRMKSHFLGDSSLFIMRAYRILLSLFIVLLPVAASAGERDILEIARERPPKVFVNGVPGDPKLAAAVDALADIPHPWTVPTIIEVFDK